MALEEYKINAANEESKPRILSPAFGKYVTYNHGFIEFLDSIRTRMNSYINRPSVRRPLNFLISAPPGSGKSFLIKQLIESLKADNGSLEISFEEIYVASLESAAELYNIFQRVQSLNLEGKIPVVFFDEVDAPVSGHSIYAKFLAPMWDGNFYIGKDKYYLGRSIFFFAGSTLSLDEASDKVLQELGGKRKSPGGEKAIVSYEEYYSSWIKKFDEYCNEQSKGEEASGTLKSNEKLKDFRDRIDAVIRLPPISKEMLGESYVQAEYENLVLMLIRKHFPRVKWVGRECLRVLTNILMDSSSVRAAEKLIFGSNGPYGDASKGSIGDDIFDISLLPDRMFQRSISADALDADGRERFVFGIEVQDSRK